jgi:hypothetical protein
MMVLVGTQNRIKDLVNQVNLSQETQRMNGFMGIKKSLIRAYLRKYDDRYFDSTYHVEVSYLVTATCSAYLCRYVS